VSKNVLWLLPAALVVAGPAEGTVYLSIEQAQALLFPLSCRHIADGVKRLLATHEVVLASR
jgi:hypothetical protein